MHPAPTQRGFSPLGTLLMLAVVAFLGTTGARMVPHYFDYRALDKIITSVEAERAAGLSSVRGFHDYVEKGLAVNRIKDIDLQSALAVRIEGEHFLVRLKYEKREPLIGNLDLLANFDKEYRLRMP